MNACSPDWRPSASLATLDRRALALAAARAFFTERGVMEIETPLIVSHPVSDPQLANVNCRLGVRPGVAYYLHTSPEYHMKRLLAAGAPDIYQICKVFRDGELGPRHLPEFTIVEWYRRGAGYDRFIEEACDFVRAIGACVGRVVPRPGRQSYRTLFQDAAGLDPLTATLDDIHRRALDLISGGISAEVTRGLGRNRTAWLDLLMVSVVEPSLRGAGLVAVDRYPADQAALARLDAADTRVAERFEIYLDGVELANGYHELADADEQRRRFEHDGRQRRAAGLAAAATDPAFIAALQAGLPDCCGVALGFDRLLMTCLGLPSIGEAVSFVTPEDA